MAKTFIDYDTITRGDSFHKDVWILYKGAATDITGYAFRFTMKRTTDDPDGAALAQLTVGSGITTDDANGKVSIDIPWATMNGIAVTPGFYVCDLQMKTPDNKIRTPYKLVLSITADVTRTQP